MTDWDREEAEQRIAELKADNARLTARLVGANEHKLSTLQNEIVELEQRERLTGKYTHRLEREAVALAERVLDRKGIPAEMRMMARAILDLVGDD